MNKTNRYLANKKAAIFNNKEPTMTDQAGADATNVNVIVKQFKIHRTLPGHTKPPIEADLSLLPSDLRTMIEITREIGTLRNTLPRELRDKTQEELDSMTNAQLLAILTPPETPPANKEEPK